MSYESADLVESGSEGLVAAPSQRTRPWRRIGVAVAATAAIGAVMGTMALRSRPVTLVERLHVVRGGLLKAFSARSLAEAADMKVRMEFLLAEEGQDEDTIDEMSIEAAVMQADDQGETLQIRHVFAAKAGKGEALVAQFKKLLDAVADVAPEASQVVEVEAGGEDEAVVTVTPPEEEKDGEDATGRAEQDFEKAFEDNAPEFTASLSMGRTVAEMYENIKTDNIIMLPKGVKGHVDAALAHAMFTAAEEAAEARQSDQGKGNVQIMSALSSAKMTESFRYRAAADMGDVPKLDQVVAMIAGALRGGGIPDPILHAAAGLADLADGLKSAEIVGLPNKYTVSLTCKNVHITPLLKDLIGDLPDETADETPDEAPDEAADEAPAPADEDR